MSNRAKNSKRAIAEAKASLEDIAYRLKQWRTAYKLTQSEVCKTLDVPISTWSNYEQGTRRIPLDTALKLQFTFGIHLGWIYTGLRACLKKDEDDILYGQGPIGADGREIRQPAQNSN